MNKLFHWATGAGKTKAALDLIGSLAPVGPEILILVPERQNIQGWKDEMAKWSCVLEDCCTIKCYASINKMKNTKWDFLVLDECHHICPPKKVQALKTIKADHVIALSATPGNSLPVLENIFGTFEVSKKKLNELIDQGKLPKPEVFVYDLRLNDESIDEPSEWTQYRAICNQIKKEQRKFYRSNFEGDKYRMLQSGLQRKRMLGQFKVPYVDYLLKKIWDKRYIVFCPTIEIARELYSLNPSGSACVDSTNSIKANDENIKAFNNGDKDHLFVVGMLNEGTNLKDVDAGVLMQLDKGERTLIQKFGRTLRSEHPKMYFFRFKDTVDDELVKNIAWNIDSKHITNWEFSRKLLNK